jgi:membrane-associated phospholipid phosphatase
MKSWLLVVLSCLATLVASPLAAQTVGGATPDAGPVLPSFASLFRDLPGDFANLVAPETGIILGAGGALSLAVHPADRRLTRSAVTSVLEDPLDPGQVIGDGWVQIGGALGTYLVGRASHNARIATLGGELVRAQIVTGVLTEGIKLAVRRTRPDGSHLSFPSGHTSATFATATVLQREFGWKVGVPAYAAATAVAVSRMTENKHYASDVAFGAAIGLVAGRRLTMHRAGGDLTLSPLAVPGGAGVGVAWHAAH